MKHSSCLYHIPHASHMDIDVQTIFFTVGNYQTSICINWEVDIYSNFF